MDGTWHTRLDESLSEDDFRKFTKFLNDTNTPEYNLERATLLGFTGSKIAPGANVRLGQRGSIGKNVFVGLHSYVNGDVVLEDDVLIGPFCSITSNTHLFNPDQQSFRGRNTGQPIKIGRGSWLAAGVTVTAGVEIGKANLIVANTVVTKSTNDYDIIGGTPGRVLGSIDPHTGDLIWASRNSVVPKEAESNDPESVEDDQVDPKEELKLLQQKYQDLEKKNSELQTQCLVAQTQLEEKDKLIKTLLSHMSNNNKESR